MNPKVSIVIPLYNKENSIKRTIESVLMQDYHFFEVIVVNDGSNDRSIEIVSEIRDERIKLFNKSNGGVSSARNMGVQKAQFEYIVFLDGDDILLPEALKTLSSLIIKYQTKIAVANFFWGFTEERKNLFSSFKKEGILENNYRSWCLEEFCPRAGATIIEKELVLNHPFSKNISRYEDAEFIFEILRYNKVAYSPTPIMIYTFEFGGLATNLSDMNKDFIYYLDFKDKSFWEKISLGQLYAQGLKSYKKDKRKLNDKYKNYIMYMYVARFVNIWLRLKRKYFRIKK